MGTATNVYTLTLIVYCLIVSNTTNLARAFSVSLTNPANHEHRVTSRDYLLLLHITINPINATRSQLHARTLNFVAAPMHYKFLNIVLSSLNARRDFEITYGFVFSSSL